jgi:succinyl-CoA synthetase beta subunit
MARKKIREYEAKLILAKLPEISWEGALVSLDTPIPYWPKVTIKPDHLFGKRKKHGLVLLDVIPEQANQFIQNHPTATIGKVTDKLTHFLVEPFIPHEREYYLAITSERDHNLIHFSEEGGINIEDNWDKVTTIKVPTGERPLVDFKNNLINSFVKQVYEIFLDYNFTYLEINPFTIVNSKIIPLDTVAYVDSCSDRWKDFEFPKPFGRKIYPEEEFVQQLDQNSGASLKLTILNPKGRIWNILSGGGASIIMLDTIAHLGKADEIANYGEYSGNPTEEESYQYAKTILQVMTKEPPGKKILFIAGAIANFTDVKKTFTGIAKAIEEYSDKLSNVKIFIRRGGPNYKAGLKLMDELKERTKLSITIHGPETEMVSIVKEAI